MAYEGRNRGANNHHSRRQSDNDVGDAYGQDNSTITATPIRLPSIYENNNSGGHQQYRQQAHNTHESSQFINDFNPT